MTTEELAVELDHEEALKLHNDWVRINLPEVQAERVAWADCMEEKCSLEDKEQITALRFNIVTVRARRKEIKRRLHAFDILVEALIDITNMSADVAENEAASTAQKALWKVFP